MIRYVLFGGRFDPVHRGHLAIARHVLWHLPEVESIVFIPAGHPPHRAPETLTPGALRLVMLALALQAWPRFRIWDYELVHGARPTYTLHTLRAFRSTWNAAPDQVAFLCGTDAFLEFHTWHGAPEHLREAYWFVVQRPPHRRTDVQAYVEARWPGVPVVPIDAVRDHVPPAVVYFDGLNEPARGTDVRTAIARGEPFEDLVPPEVAAFIHRYRLYRPGEPRWLTGLFREEMHA